MIPIAPISSGGRRNRQARPSASADVIVVTKTFFLPIAPGIVEFSTPKLGGRTPKAALFFSNNHSPENDGVTTAGYKWVVGGVADNQFTNYVTCADDSASVEVYRNQRDDACFEMVNSNGGAQQYLATLDSLIPNGVRLNFSAASAAVRRITIIFFAGDDVEAHIGSINLGTATSPINVNFSGFEPDVVFFSGSNQNNDGDQNQFANHTFGIAVNDGADTQRAIGRVDDDGASVSNPQQTIRDDCAGLQLATSGGGVSHSYLVSDFDADGFSITPSSSTASDFIYYLSLRLGGLSVALVDINAETSVGPAEVNVGFRPQAYLGITSSVLALNTIYEDDNAEGVCVIAGDEHHQSYALGFNQDNVTTTNAGNQQYENKASAFVFNDQADVARASFEGFNSAGIALNYSDAGDEAYLGFLFAVADPRYT